MTPRLILATHNEGKVAELRAMIATALPECDPLSIISAAHLGLDEPVEDGTTFADNAIIKARAVAQATGVPALADDSGLCVDIMGGAPGIFSARWCGHHGNDQANLQLLLDQLHDVPAHQRGAAFVCAAALVIPGREPHVCEGRMAGRLLTQPVGESGFGYDPIFVPTCEDEDGGLGRSTAQMSASEKNAISHRGQAMAAMMPALVKMLSESAS